jgi:NAD(P)-dependent dehydrogenase (short-subunit alcohol dehydrogenase family)
MRGLRDKAVLITGGTSGIGLATARRFLQEGARTFVCGIDAQSVDATVDELSALGPIAGTACDVSVEDDVDRLLRAAERHFGALDVLANNAGIATKRRFLDLQPAEWDRTIAVNLRGMYLVARAAARWMVGAGRGGAIVNMASTNALGGEEEFAHYNASKGGVLQLTRSMAVELGGQNVRVNCLCPGFIDTPLNRGMADEAQFRAYADDAIPLGRYGRADEVAAAYAFLASDEASFVHGAALVVDGGQTAVM